uniref:Neuronal regeneration-related protein n=1 Tax=Terrapene triunguis TaxID=2587831 RepID=A0A674KGL0_9SAUR
TRLVCSLCSWETKYSPQRWTRRRETLRGNLTIPKEVNRKKNNETEAAFLTPANGYGYHFIEINYLYPF